MRKLFCLVFIFSALQVEAQKISLASPDNNIVYTFNCSMAVLFISFLQKESDNK